MLNTPKHPGHPGPGIRKAWSVDEARELIGGISRKKIYDLFNSGELRSVMIAGRRLVPDAAIDELIDELLNNRNTPAA